MVYTFIISIYVDINIRAIPTYNCYTEGQLSFGITNLDCSGSEEHIFNCTHSNPVLYNCLSCNDAGLICQSIYIMRYIF